MGNPGVGVAVDPGKGVARPEVEASPVAGGIARDGAAFDSRASFWSGSVSSTAAAGADKAVGDEAAGRSALLLAQAVNSNVAANHIRWTAPMKPFRSLLLDKGRWGR
ncbi:hypothetical protein [Candidatus Poriferisocius sp.]|uniref:hypothetical protein n=1 Tax=Candidatus Poriferisocius sp. TaxID=3101276 RepID=UPI003B52FCC3